MSVVNIKFTLLPILLFFTKYKTLSLMSKVCALVFAKAVTTWVLNLR